MPLYRIKLDLDLAIIPAKSNVPQKIKLHDAENAIEELKLLNWVKIMVKF